MGKNIKKILITGGAGFVGSELSRKLVKDGYQVTIVDNFSSQIHGDKDFLSDDLTGFVKLLKGSVADKKLLYEALDGQDAVIHYAAETGTGQSMYDIGHYSNINIQATANLCDYLVNNEHDIKTVIVASSRSIYGEGKYKSETHGYVYPNARTYDKAKHSFEVECPKSGSFNLKLVATDEDSIIHPSSFYGITKQVQEQMILLACKLKAINAFALRYQNVYGPGQSLKNPYTGILSIFSRLALQNEPINIFEDGLETRDFVYIDDVVNATASCLTTIYEGQYAINIGSGVPTSVLEVAKEITSYLKSTSEIEVSGVFREGDIRHNYADLTIAKKILNFHPQWSFKEGISQFLDWVSKQEDIPPTNDDYKRSLKELKQKGLLNG
ncbi:MAG: NAD-dependent epimerase/dehydratase family protein [Bacteroidota bacterium]